MNSARRRPGEFKRRLFNVNEVADALGVCTKTVRRRIAEGVLPYHLIGRQIRVSGDDFDAYIATQRRRALSS